MSAEFRRVKPADASHDDEPEGQKGTENTEGTDGGRTPSIQSEGADAEHLLPAETDGPELPWSVALDFTSEHPIGGAFPEEFILAEQMDQLRSPEGW